MKEICQATGGRRHRPIGCSLTRQQQRLPKRTIDGLDLKRLFLPADADMILTRCDELGGYDRPPSELATMATSRRMYGDVDTDTARQRKLRERSPILICRLGRTINGPTLESFGAFEPIDIPVVNTGTLLRRGPSCSSDPPWRVTGDQAQLGPRLPRTRTNAPRIRVDAGTR